MGVTGRQAAEVGVYLRSTLVLLGGGGQQGAEDTMGRKTDGFRTEGAMLKARCGAGAPGSGWSQGGAQKLGRRSGTLVAGLREDSRAAEPSANTPGL